MAQDTSAGQSHPTGADIRTFLFADMRGYTRYTQERGDDAASALASRFADLVREAVPEFEGELLELRGDEALCVFRSARQALRAAVELQRRLRTERDKDPAFPIGVGIGLDAGEAVPTHGGYRGASLNLAARLCALAGAGEILATESVAHLAQRVSGIRLVEGRSANVKGIERPVRLVRVVPDQPLPPLPAVPYAVGRSRSWRWRYLAPVAALGALLVAGSVLELRSPPTKQAAGVGGIPLAGIVKVSRDTAGADDALALRPNPGAVVDMAFGSGSLWITTSTGLDRVDPRTGRIVASTGLTDGGAPLAIGLGDVFVTGGGIGTNNVQVIDPHTMGVVRVIQTQPFNPDNSQGVFYVAAGSGSLWVWGSGGQDCCSGRSFWRIRPSDGHVLHRWLPPNAGGDNYTGVQDAVTVGAGGVWLVRNDRLWRINPQTNTEAGGLKVGNASMITTAAGAVWAVSPQGVVSEINPALPKIVWTRTFHGLFVDEIAADQRSLWLLDGSDRRLVELDATTGRTLLRARLPIPPGGARLAVGQNSAWIGYPPG